MVVERRDKIATQALDFKSPRRKRVRNIVYLQGRKSHEEKGKRRMLACRNGDIGHKG